MLSPELESAIRRALDDATARGHEFSALEHLLLALLADEKTAEVVKHCGGSVGRLTQKLEDYLTTSLQPLPEDERDRAQPTRGFARVVQRARATGKRPGPMCWWRCSPSRSRTRSPS
jgi:ATP-dependent Clp protease ATP-binding subunit ClpA